MVVFHLSCSAVLFEAAAFTANPTTTTTSHRTSHCRAPFLPSNPWSTAHVHVHRTLSSRRTLYKKSGPIGESGEGKALLARVDASANTNSSTDTDDQSGVEPLAGSPPLSVTLDGDPDDYSYNDAIQRTLGWVGAAIIFGGGVWAIAGSATGEEFFAGYLVEQSLSVDNLFVFLLLFDYFKVPLAYQDRVLNWGIYGAIVMRAVMIGLGAAALKNFREILLVFAAILVYSSGSALLGGEDEDEDPSQNSIVKFSRSLINSVDYFDGDRFFTLVNGVRQATPLFICMVALEISDVVFAVDSIPAVFGVTEVCEPYKLKRRARALVQFPGIVYSSQSYAHLLYIFVMRACVVVVVFCLIESSGGLFIQHFCHYGIAKSLHDFVQGGDGPQVPGTCSGASVGVHWRKDDCRILWIRSSNGSCLVCGCLSPDRWCWIVRVGQAKQSQQPRRSPIRGMNMNMRMII